MKYFIANWKANKNIEEVKEWTSKFLKNYQDNKNKKIIICPPFPFLYFLKEKISRFKNLFLGAQNISFFEEGSYTGEVTAKNLQGLVNFVIIGHSERKKYFKENSKVLLQKLNLALKYQIEPIFCLEKKDDFSLLNSSIKIIAYEPSSAIGTGNNQSVEEILKFKQSLAIKKETIFIYGGSVNEKNVRIYAQSNKIDGFLVGNASLNPHNFLNIININNKK
ncbi:MAG: triose-phosphate isomerase [Patescibacteria group bacterium]|nr:triose-phosphate isomerase [Patescibacteria group bacterium]